MFGFCRASVREKGTPDETLRPSARETRQVFEREWEAGTEFLEREGEEGKPFSPAGIRRQDSASIAYN